MKAGILLLSLFAVLLTGTLSAQILIKGKVLDGKNDQPIAYTNIGIINTRVGTIANGDGTFSIQIPAQH
ncbi:MAG TPA: carboxypeptidase-like regulatory domain-containing protein, partial [Algoriphagus sp.]|nr:carboxypeptidase-like regulatory domain-containing protein [Algoriphagus sp.]